MARILLVEDDLRISDPLARMLQVEGFDVEHHETGLGALDAVRQQRPDLVLLDLTLPDLDGVDVCRTLRGEDPTLPIVMLTARSEQVDVGSGPAPTTMSPSPSAWPSCWPASTPGSAPSPPTMAQ